MVPYTCAANLHLKGENCDEAFLMHCKLPLSWLVWQLVWLYGCMAVWLVWLVWQETSKCSSTVTYTSFYCNSVWQCSTPDPLSMPPSGCLVMACCQHEICNGLLFGVPLSGLSNALFLARTALLVTAGHAQQCSYVDDLSQLSC